MKINEKVIAQIKQEAQAFHVGASGCHDWTHVERVYNLALRIGKEEKADLGVVRAAAYLHDIGRKQEMKSRGKIDHAEAGMKLAGKILARFDLDPEAKENLLHCILSHRSRNEHRPATLEAKILYDADKLDSIGAIGIGRDFLFAGLSSGCLYTGNEKKCLPHAAEFAYTREDTALLEYYYKLRQVKSKIFTRSGKKIAQERHAFMVEFFRRFELEIKGAL